MKILSFVLKRLLYPSCAFFTIIWFVVCVAIDAFYDIVNINVSTALMCYFIAFFIALSNNIGCVGHICDHIEKLLSCSYFGDCLYFVCNSLSGDIRETAQKKKKQLIRKKCKIRFDV